MRPLVPAVLTAFALVGCSTLFGTDFDGRAREDTNRADDDAPDDAGLRSVGVDGATDAPPATPPSVQDPPKAVGKDDAGPDASLPLPTTCPLVDGGATKGMTARAASGVLTFAASGSNEKATLTMPVSGAFAASVDLSFGKKWSMTSGLAVAGGRFVVTCASGASRLVEASFGAGMNDLGVPVGYSVSVDGKRATFQGNAKLSLRIASSGTAVTLGASQAGVDLAAPSSATCVPTSLALEGFDVSFDGMSVSFDDLSVAGVCTDAFSTPRAW